MRIMRINFQQFVHKRAIIDHGLPHFFRSGFAALPSHCERARSTVILNDHGMIHGQVGGPALEVLERIAARGHHLGHELVGLPHRVIWVVHEARLNATPFTGKRGDLFLSELVQVESADTLGALPENRVRSISADSLNGSFVFRSKALAQVDPLPTARVIPGRQDKQQDHNTNPDDHEGL